jgi:hypothetical protein
MKKTFLVLILIVISLVFVAQPTFAAPAPEREPFVYKFMVPLPTPSGTATSTSGIVNYLMILYSFLFGIAGVLAMGLIIYSGFQWVTAGGNHSNISQAKARISNAILGLIILLSSWVILQTINPNLTKLKEPYVQFMTWDKEFKDDGSAGTTPGTGTGTTAPDWCTDYSVNACGDYDAAAGGSYNSGGFMLHLDDQFTICQNNECGIGGASGCFYESTGGYPGCDDCVPAPCDRVATGKCGRLDGIPVIYCGVSCIYDNNPTSPTFNTCQPQ